MPHRVAARQRALRGAAQRAQASRRQVSCRAAPGPSFLGGDLPEHAQQTVQSIREAVAHSNCAPYSDIAGEETLIINPPWLEEARTTGLSHAVCGVTTPTKYTEEHVRPIAAAYETDGSIFLLWERRAAYLEEGSQQNTKHTEDICGVTYVKKDRNSQASVIATFRQPTPEERRTFFKPDHELVIRPGSDNFFSGRFAAETPVGDAQMVAAVRQFYECFNRAGGIEEALAHIADPKLRVKEPMWEVSGSYLPVNRIEAAMWMERMVKNASGKLKFSPRAIAPAEGTNMVFALWFAEGLDTVETAGVHVFFFGDDLKIRSVAAFREPTKQERKFNFLSSMVAK